MLIKVLLNPSLIKLWAARVIVVKQSKWAVILVLDKTRVFCLSESVIDATSTLYNLLDISVWTLQSHLV